MGLLAIALLAHGPPSVVYVFAILAAPAFNATRPTMNVVLPAAVHTPDELTAETPRWAGSRARASWSVRSWPPA